MPMSKSFQIKLLQPPEAVVAQARTAAHEHGVHLDGTAERGRFSGHGIEGHYLIRADILAVEISKKPFILPWSMVETTLRRLFA